RAVFVFSQLLSQNLPGHGSGRPLSAVISIDRFFAALLGRRPFARLRHALEPSVSHGSNHHYCSPGFPGPLGCCQSWTVCFRRQLFLDGNATGCARLAQLPRFCILLFHHVDIVPGTGAQATPTRRSPLRNTGDRGRQHRLLLCRLHRLCRLPRRAGPVSRHGLHGGTSRLGCRGRRVLRLDRVDDSHGQGHVHGRRAPARRQGDADER
ncbi:hypothetical protein TPAR_01726, partial [Tolypocladium paradoxum]